MCEASRASAEGLQGELTKARSALAVANQVRFAQQQEMEALQGQVSSLSASVAQLRTAAARQREREGNGEDIGVLLLDSKLQREVEAMRRDWAGAEAVAPAVARLSTWRPTRAPS